MRERTTLTGEYTDGGVTREAMADESGELRARLARALEVNERATQRLARAGTSVTFRVDDSDEESVTLLLDRYPPELVGAGEPAEVLIQLTKQQASLFLDGGLVLPTAIYEGRVGCRGPVRKYLQVDPILRGLLLSR
jgi:hypothetical protein